MRLAVTSINRSRPKFAIVTGNFTAASAGTGSSSAIQRSVFRKAISRVSESIPVLFVPGPADVGFPTTS